MNGSVASCGAAMLMIVGDGWGCENVGSRRTFTFAGALLCIGRTRPRKLQRWSEVLETLSAARARAGSEAGHDRAGPRFAPLSAAFFAADAALRFGVGKTPLSMHARPAQAKLKAHSISA